MFGFGSNRQDIRMIEAYEAGQVDPRPHLPPNYWGEELVDERPPYMLTGSHLSEARSKAGTPPEEGVQMEFGLYCDTALVGVFGGQGTIVRGEEWCSPEQMAFILEQIHAAWRERLKWRWIYATAAFLFIQYAVVF